MVTTTSTYKTDIAALYRQARIRGTITLTDYTVIDVTEADIFADSLYVDEQIVPGEDFALGGCVASEMGLRLKTTTGAAALSGAKIDLDYQLLLTEGTGTVYSTVADGVFDTSDDLVPSIIPATADFEPTQYYEVEFTSGALDGNVYRISTSGASSWSGAKDYFIADGVSGGEPDAGDTFIVRSYEVVPLGIYYVNEAKRRDNYVDIVAFDATTWADRVTATTYGTGFDVASAYQACAFYGGYEYSAIVKNSVDDKLIVSASYAAAFNDYYGWNVRLTTNSSDALSVTLTPLTLTINIKLANATASKNTAALIEAAIQALYDAGGDEMEQYVDNIVCTAVGDWDTTSVATGEGSIVYLEGGQHFTYSSLGAYPNATTTVAALGQALVLSPYREKLSQFTRLMGGCSRLDRHGNVELKTIYPTMVSKNVISNGDFASTTGWSVGGSTNAAASNILSNTGNGTSATPYTYQTTSVEAVESQQIYVKAKFRVTNSSCSSIRFVMNATSGTSRTFTLQTSPTINVWYEQSAVFTVTGLTGDLKLWIQHLYADAATANGKVLQVQYFCAINLTAEYGSGYEPTAPQMDALLNTYDSTNKWFDGTVKLDRANKLTNMVTHGNFDATTDWTAVNGTGAVASNTYSLTGNGTAASPYIQQTIAYSTGHKYYIKARARVTNSSCTLLKFYSDNANLIAQQSNPAADTWYDFAVANTYASGSTILCRQYYADAATANGKVMQVQYVAIIDLTATYGAGLEPTAATMNALLANLEPNTSWFNGSQNVIQVDRSISKAERYRTDVSDNLIQVTQLIANANGALFTSGTDGLTMQLPDITVCQYLSSATIQTMIDNILTEVTKVKYYPFELEFIGDPSLQPGDWITISDTGNEVDDPITLITHSTWRFRGHQTLRGVGISYDYIKPVSQSTRDITDLRSQVQATLEVVATGSAAWNVPSLAGQATSETDITATGAALGDFAIVSCGVDSQSIKFSASVTATNTVTVVAFNPTASTTIDLASTTFKVVVLRIR